MIKKALSVLLAGLLVMGMATTAFAASGKITGMAKIISEDYEDLEVTPGEVIKIPLTADMFEWSGNEAKEKEKVTSSQISNGKVALKTSYAKSKSKDIIKDISLETSGSFSGVDGKTAYIQVKFVEDYTSTKEVEFEFSVYLTIGSKKQTDSTINFSGTFGRETYELEDDEDYVDLSDGIMVEAPSYMREVEAYLGEGVTITTSMSKGKKYYGTADRGIENEDEKIADAYPEIVSAITISTNLTDGKVTLELDDDYYVYNADGKYVGTSDEELKYSNKYYLADEKINLSSSTSKDKDKDKDDDDDDDDDKDKDTVKVVDDDDKNSVPVEDNNYNNNSGAINDNPNTGGDDNPSTGNGYKVLSALALAGASAVTICCLNGKKRR